MVCGTEAEFGDWEVLDLILPSCTNSFLCFLAYPTIASVNYPPWVSNYLPLPVLHPLATNVHRLPMSAPNPFAVPAPRLSNLFAPAISASAVHSPDVRGSLRPHVPSLPTLFLPVTSATLSALPASALHSSTAPATWCSSAWRFYSP